MLQEVFAAAFNAVLADEREINVRPWLYRIARNRSLNHLRRDHRRSASTRWTSTSPRAASRRPTRCMRRENFRELIADVQELPETQRTALLLREIDALSYEQIAQAMETTVPSVKSLLVRARISLAEAAESRKLSCEEVRLELGEAAEGLTKLSTPARRHVRGCERCRAFRKQLKDEQQGAGRDPAGGAAAPAQEACARQARLDRLGRRRPRRRRRRRDGRRRRLPPAPQPAAAPAWPAA